jgi:hypothetical protein
VLLPFLAEFMQDRSPYRDVKVELVRDGSMRFRLREGRRNYSLLWSDKVFAESPGRQDTTKVRRHVAKRLERLLAGDPPHLLLFRNRNPQRIQWGPRLFNNLCPGLLKKGHTRYYDYTVTDIDMYEGFINVEFTSRKATVTLRLTLQDPPPEKPLISWGPITLTILRDDRKPSQRKLPEQQVEEFLGYLLSRNLPPRFLLQFEFDDPPAGYLPPDSNVDFIRTKRLDDTSFFEMLLASSSDIGIVTSCDRECFNLFSMVASPKESWIVNTPWQTLPSSSILTHCYNVNLTTDKTILGSDSIEKCLDALNRSENPPGLVIFIDSCLHRLIGEDVRPPLEAFREKSSIPLVHYDIRTTQHPYLQQLRDFWKNTYQAVADKDLIPQPPKVCFLGLNPDPSGDIDNTLKHLGILPAARIFPHLPLDQMRTIASCGLVVMSDWEYTRIMFTDLLEELKRPVLRLPLPYGIEGTTDWLVQIHRLVYEQDAGSVDLPQAKRTFERFHTERQHIKGNRIGLFARNRGLRNRISSRLRFGVPLVGFLHELGLSLDLNLFLQPDEVPDPDQVIADLDLDPSQGDSVSYYTHFKQLPEKLESGDFPLVYTETFRDERIISAGKTPLSLNQLRPGYQGAVHTARLVRSLLSSNFYRNYRWAL